MIIKVTRSMFHDQFHAYGRINNFSYEARNVLYDYYEELEEDIGENIELDVIAICCDWTECSEEEIHLDEARENTTVLDVPGNSYLVLAF